MRPGEIMNRYIHPMLNFDAYAQGYNFDAYAQGYIACWPLFGRC